jgi:uncharacterized protein with NRDE domain
MCTLTYRLTQTGYELFFNRDEQRSRAQALPPQINRNLNAIYPIDPVGKGTWLAVHQSGLSLALLNYYQAEKKTSAGHFNSRGEIILTLLKKPDKVIEVLRAMILSSYQAFQLCVFASNLTRDNNKLHFFQWDGEFLTELVQTLPITSSGVDYEQVYQARKIEFKKTVTSVNPTAKQLLSYHQSQQLQGKLSVKMSRVDAQTVSFSRISVAEEIEFEYVDYLDNQQSFSVLSRV